MERNLFCVRTKLVWEKRRSWGAFWMASCWAELYYRDHHWAIHLVEWSRYLGGTIKSLQVRSQQALSFHWENQNGISSKKGLEGTDRRSHLFSSFAWLKNSIGFAQCRILLSSFLNHLLKMQYPSLPLLGEEYWYLILLLKFRSCRIEPLKKFPLIRHLLVLADLASLGT